MIAALVIGGIVTYLFMVGISLSIWIHVIPKFHWEHDTQQVQRVMLPMFWPISMPVGLGYYFGKKILKEKS